MPETDGSIEVEHRNLAVEHCNLDLFVFTPDVMLFVFLFDLVTYVNIIFAI